MHLAGNSLKWNGLIGLLTWECYNCSNVITEHADLKSWKHNLSISKWFWWLNDILLWHLRKFRKRGSILVLRFLWFLLNLALGLSNWTEKLTIHSQQLCHQFIWHCNTSGCVLRVKGPSNIGIQLTTKESQSQVSVLISFTRAMAERNGQD